MRFLPIILILIFLSAAADAQEDRMYKQLIWQARAYYSNKDYKRSAETLETAIALKGDNAGYIERYNAACSWSMAGDTAKVFQQLFYLANRITKDPEGYFGKNQMDPLKYSDKDFDPIRNDTRWTEFMHILKRRRSHLVNALDTIFLNDQAARKRLEEVEAEYGHGSDELKAHWGKINRQDSINLVKVKQIIDTFGWPGVDDVGRRGNSAVFLVIQHADPETQEHYLPIMRAAVKDGKALRRDLALLEDRVALGKGQPQKYGTQVGRIEGSPWYLRPLQNVDSVDTWRKEMGLGGLYFYLRHFDINWDAEQYKKDQPKIEAMEQRMQGG